MTGNAPVAQWIEQETSKLLAVSSILTRGTKYGYTIYMDMLRDFQYRPTLGLVKEAIGKFREPGDDRLSIVRFEVITPDSFMWRIATRTAVYYLYAEDYVPGLEHVTGIIDTYLKGAPWRFIPARESISFEDSTPVRTANTYKKPGNTEEMMLYAVDAGFDFCFLIRSEEDPEDACVSEEAPRGFRGA